MQNETPSNDNIENNPDVSPRKSDALSAESGAPNSVVTIEYMQDELETNNHVTPPSTAPAESDWIAKAIKSGRMLSSKEVANMFGFKSI